MDTACKNMQVLEVHTLHILHLYGLPTLLMDIPGISFHIPGFKNISPDKTR